MYNKTKTWTTFYLYFCISSADLSSSMGSVAIKSRVKHVPTRERHVSTRALNCSRNSTPFWCIITLLFSSSVTKVRNVFANIRGYCTVTPLSCPPRHAPLVAPLVTRSSRPPVRAWQSEMHDIIICIQNHCLDFSVVHVLLVNRQTAAPPAAAAGRKTHARGEVVVI